ncbi:MAG: hypothetical protein WCD80_01325 [Desulfobaccales bacterium]
MKLVISVDVEEEGLFSGQYPRTPPGVRNVAALNRLQFIPREFGFPLTLLVSYQVALDPAACRVLAHWQETYGAEIGVHLHPWNTPPFADLPYPEPIPSQLLPASLLRDKLAALVRQVQGSLGVTPRSFRMGRFDWGPQVMALLPEFGLRVDSSIVPLTAKSSNPEDFLAPADPFCLPGRQVAPLLEAPLTLVPVLPGTPRAIYGLSRALPGPWGHRLRDRFRYLGAVGVQPAWYPLACMQLAARLHRRRGGRVLTLFFHSSELQPGATRLFPTEEAVNLLVGKIRIFLNWLSQTWTMEGAALSDLYEIYRPEKVEAKIS